MNDIVRRDLLSPHKPYLRSLFWRGVARCTADVRLAGLLPTDAPRGRTIVLGAGKAAAAMAAVAAATLRGVVTGCVVTRIGHGTARPTGEIRVIEAAHPVPDDSSVAAAEAIYALAAAATADDRVIFLMSGGGSALMCLPCDGVSLAEKRDITLRLLQGGAPIRDINLVRTSLSKIKGGRLAAAARRAQAFTYVISDVVGDDPALIASGPSVGGPVAPERVFEILERTGYPLTLRLRASILANARVEVPPHPVAVIARNEDALAAVAEAVSRDGWTPVVLPGLEGIASGVGAAHAELARACAAQGGRHALISGGELTVEVRNPRGRGGPNLEYLAALAAGIEGSVAADGTPLIEALAGDTDGIDGSERNAGGYVSSLSAPRARAAGFDMVRALERNDTHPLFAALGDLIVTGPTLTNVNDLRIILVGGAAPPEPVV
jgi:glycerate-2-kinase